MSAPGRFDQPMRHQRPGRNNRVHNAPIDQLGDHQALLGDGHRTGERHDDEAVLVARHGLQHIGSFAELAARKRRLGHRAHQVVNGMNLAEVERFQRNQTIGHRIVQPAVDTRAFCVIFVVMMAMLRDTFLLQRTNLPNENDFGRRNNLLEVRATRDGFNIFQTQDCCQREDATLFDLAEPIPGPGTEKLAAAARQNKVVLIASLFEKRAPGLYHNTAAIFDSDGVLRGIYRKMHIPDDPLYYEKFYFTPGDLGFKAFDTSAGKLGALVCWDQWYPEGARLTALQGASILFYPTAIGWHPAEKAEFGEAQHDAWRTIQRAHAIANGVYVGVVNRVGFETGDIRGNAVPGKGLEFWGGSFFCDSFGRGLAESSHDKEEILLGEVDLPQLEDIRRNWHFLRDRRIDAYAPITSRMIDEK